MVVPPFGAVLIYWEGMIDAAVQFNGLVVKAPSWLPAARSTFKISRAPPVGPRRS